MAMGHNGRQHPRGDSSSPSDCNTSERRSLKLRPPDDLLRHLLALQKHHGPPPLPSVHALGLRCLGILPVSLYLLLR